jgi:hypothetical protein
MLYQLPMKKQLLYLFTLFNLGVNAQKLTPIDELSIGMNYSLPEATFSTHSTDEKVISQHTESKAGYSLGIINILRKDDPFQYIFGIELNYLTFDYETNYETTSFNPNDNNWYGLTIQDNLKGSLNSIMISVPFLFRYNLSHTKSKLPFFIDAGFKYDFITVYHSEYEIKYYQYNSKLDVYSKEILEGKTRPYNNRYNINLMFGIGIILKRTSLKLSYTLPYIRLETKILNDFGSGNVKMNYLNFSVNYKLRK